MSEVTKTVLGPALKIRTEFIQDIRDDEAEACAKIAKELIGPITGNTGDISSFSSGWEHCAEHIAKAIRQRIKDRASNAG